MVIRQDYGATEVGTISLDTRGEPDPRSVGVPLPHMEVEMRPERRDRGPEAYREVLVRSPATAAGYVDGGRLVPCVDRDGWYHTGDAGEWKGSALTLGGRLREQVVVDGRPIDLDRVEAVIRTCPGVEDVVVTTEGEGGSTTLVATVVAPSADGVELERWCARALPPHEAPARIVLRRELPRSPAGKVLGKYLP
jgi:acyl-CoA synthetase (AMP-forming)/AMP-acid ligase II